MVYAGGFLTRAYRPIVDIELIRLLFAACEEGRAWTYQSLLNDLLKHFNVVSLERTDRKGAVSVLKGASRLGHLFDVDLVHQVGDADAEVDAAAL